MAYRDIARIKSALRQAVAKGFNPYDSHAVQAACWERKQKDYMRRRSEYWANKELAR